MDHTRHRTDLSQRKRIPINDILEPILHAASLKGIPFFLMPNEKCITANLHGDLPLLSFPIKLIRHPGNRKEAYALFLEKNLRPFLEHGLLDQDAADRLRQLDGCPVNFPEGAYESMYGILRDKLRTESSVVSELAASSLQPEQNSILRHMQAQASGRLRCMEVLRALQHTQDGKEE